MSRPFVNVLANALSSLLTAGASLVTIPYLLKQYGADTYGLWALIVATNSLFLIFDLGLNTSVGRLVAASRASQDSSELNRVFSTGIALLSVVSGIVLVATAISCIVFPRLFHIPDHQAVDVTYALIITGAGVAFYFQTAIFTCVLWGYERFDLLNSAAIPVLLARTALVFILIDGSSLSALAGITFFANVAGSAACGYMCLRTQPALAFSSSFVNWHTARRIVDFSWRLVILNSARILTSQVGTYVTGHAINNRTVATFNIAQQIVSYCNSFMSSTTQVAVARATNLHFLGAIEQQRQLLTIGGRWATALTTFLVSGFLFLGQSFIHLWQGGRQDEAYLPLVILLLGEALPMSQWVTYSTIFGMGKQPQLTGLALLELIIAALLAWTLVGPFGLMGVCVAIATGGVVRGIGQLVYGCMAVDVSLLSYSRAVFLPIAIPAAIQYAIFWFLLQHHSPSSWMELLAYGMGYAMLYAVLVGPALITWQTLMQLVGTLGALAHQATSARRKTP